MPKPWGSVEGFNRGTELWDESAAARVISLFSAKEGRNIYSHWQFGFRPCLVFGRYGDMLSLTVSARDFEHLTALISAMNTHGLPKELTNA